MTGGGGGGGDGSGGGAAPAFYFSAATRRRDTECSAVDGQFGGSVGAPRVNMTEFMGLAEKVSKFNQEALKHIERQTLNPFSGRFSRSPSPRPKFNKDEYGKPAAGSLTEMRGQRAYTQISREILELCETISDMGARKRDSDGDECIIIPFGELFAFYSKISDKVVGLLIAAKKRGFVYFEPEILFQRRDDDVLIALMKPVEEIRNIVNRQISASNSPAPVASEPEKTSPSPTPSPLTRQGSNTPSESSSTSSEPQKALPSPAEGDPTPSSSNETKAQPANSTAASPEISPTSSIPVSLLTVEEETTSSSDTPVAVSEQAPESESVAHVEQPSPVIEAQPVIEDKENSSSIESPQASEKEQTSSLTAETEQVSQVSEPTVPTEEHAAIVEPVADSEEHDSLSLKILVAVNEVPTSSPEESDVASVLGEPEPTTLPSEVAQETSTLTAQVAPGDHEQTTTSVTTTEESTHTLPPSDNSEDIAVSTENEETPSKDTGEISSA